MLSSALTLVTSVLALPCVAGYVVKTVYESGDCTGTPITVSAFPTEQQALRFGGGDCMALPKGRQFQGEDETQKVAMLFHVEEDGNKCLVDVFSDTNCTEGKETRQMFDGTCVGKGNQGDRGKGRPSAGVGGLPASRSSLCTSEVPDRLDWNGTCLTKDKATQSRTLIKEMKEGKKTCFASCEEAEEQSWMLSKESFDAAFKTGGCAEACDAEMKDLAFFRAVIQRKIDCNFVQPAVSRSTRSVTV
mmetsp:Transcript_11789/g.26710  ORF Transcript_11789/g.26710 Transcript_11789/m.26710 type:complete len:246 (-) Transcript_11789:98-835(-)